MLFNSLEFIFLFLPVTIVLYYLISHFVSTRISKYFLILASLFFYGRRNPIYILLILWSIAFNFLIWRMLSNKNKLLLAAWITWNVLLLAYFKYADFFLANINAILGTELPLLNIILPLAISFFTFQQISYLVDSYQWKTTEYSFFDYCLFVTFFPQLIAGPIVHHNEMMPQFADQATSRVNWRNIMIGLYLFTFWLFKKAVIADTFAGWATQWFDVSKSLTMLEWRITSLSYTFQLYFDFSGYTDMALGIALMFNIMLPFNFDSPYKALDIQDFWRRRHITLSRFLKDYIYIPLGGNRKWVSRTYVNLMLTFLIWGIRHGAGWTFIFWWFLHGLALCIHRFWKSKNYSLHKILAWFLTFNFINIAWIFFRALQREDASKVLKSMFSFDLWQTNELIFYQIWAIIWWFILVLVLQNTNKIHERTRESSWYPLAFGILFFVSLVIMSMLDYTEFIYFNF